MVNRKYIVGIAALLTSASLLAASSPASAFTDITVDGILTGGVGGIEDLAYTQSFDITFHVFEDKDNEHTGTDPFGPATDVSGGKLRLGGLGNDSDFVYMFLSAPVTLVDTVFGPDNIPVPGWGDENHNLEKLIGSDGFVFFLNDLLVKADLLQKPTLVPEIKSNEDAGGALVEIATSLQWNLEQGFVIKPTGKEEPTKENVKLWTSVSAGSVQETQYELKFDKIQLKGGTILPGDITNLVLHASPNKLGGDKVIDDDLNGPPGDPPTGQVPEPSTIAVFGMGLIGLRLFRRRVAQK